MTAAEVLAAERRIDAKAESVQRELFYAARAFRRLSARIERLSAAVLPAGSPAGNGKAGERANGSAGAEAAE